MKKECKPISFEDLYKEVNHHRSFDWDKILIYLVQRGRKVYGANFRIRPSLEEVYRLVIIYAIQDKALAAKYGIALDKGLFLLGPPEVGKTAILQLCKPFFVRRDQYKMTMTRILAQEFACKGYEVFTPLFAAKAYPVCLDGVGKEEIARNYGNPCDVVKHIVAHFYDMRFAVPRPQVHITTHLTPQMLEMRYGKRFREMVAQLFNIVVVSLD